jgi:F-type H+-transporting ATPase subunit h
MLAQTLRISVCHIFHCPVQLVAKLTSYSAPRWPELPGHRLSFLAGHSWHQQLSAKARYFIFSHSESNADDVFVADLVQDLYIKELKGYKPPPVKASDADAHVQKWAVPAAPTSPEESDIAKDLKSYEEQVVEVEGQAESTEGGAAPVEDWFEEEPEEDEAAH